MTTGAIHVGDESAHVRWELLASEAAAAAREADVIVALQPARNRAIRAEEYYSFVSIERGGGLVLGSTGRYGCFPHLGHGASSAPGGRASTVFAALNHVIRATQTPA